MNSRIFQFSCLLLCHSALAQADSGSRQFELSKESRAVELTLDAATVSTTPVDFWGQCYVILNVPELLKTAALNGTGVSALYDGGCEETRAQLLEAAKDGPLKATVTIELYERVQWGITSEGTPNQQPYCQRTLNQFVYLEGPLFPIYEYQTSADLYLAPSLTYQQCIELYAQN